MGIAVFGITLIFVVCVMIFIAERSEIRYVIPIIAANTALIVLLVVYSIYFNSKMLISDEGITLISKLSGNKTFHWDECRFIGIFGYNWGNNGMLVFSKTHYPCRTQMDCKNISKKKGNLLIAYTPEVFAAIEKYAPSYLVSNVRTMMR